jgi:hypothetical protein
VAPNSECAGIRRNRDYLILAIPIGDGAWLVPSDTRADCKVMGCGRHLMMVAWRRLWVYSYKGAGTSHGRGRKRHSQ